MIHDMSADAAHMVRSTMRLLRPHDLLGAEKVRVGRFFDGGYVMVDRFDEITAAYSLGINDDVSWDMDIALRGIPVFQYDHTIPHLPEQHPLFHWEPRCIGGISQPDDNIVTLPELMEQNGHADERNLLLKCDIEGSEWPLLQMIENKHLSQFRQIVIEIHRMSYLTDFYHGNNVRRAFLNLTSSHHVVHVHGNNFSPWAVIGGYPVPEVLELTLLRKDEGSFTPSTTSFPTELDLPCYTALADMQLGTFTF